MGMFHDKVRDRLIRYARINTRSEANTGRTPSTDNQYDLARVLRDELIEIGVSNVWLDEKNCVVYGTLPSTMPDGGGRSIGYVAHMDTAPDASGTDVKPWVFEHYDGSDIVLNKELDIVMRTADYPHLKNYIGQDLVLTDGTTLLGGDDKAAIAALMTA
ncbi:MAG: peptidase T, partial [Solobacterium sp.]|nr:peptidase T [Solobacterium sp.]